MWDKLLKFLGNVPRSGKSVKAGCVVRLYGAALQVPHVVGYRALTALVKVSRLPKGSCTDMSRVPQGICWMPGRACL